jgi:hypothetical protein
VSNGGSKIGRAHTFAEKFIADETGVSPRHEEQAADLFKRGECKWIRRQHAKPCRGHLDRNILPTFGEKRLAAHTRPALSNWLVMLPLGNQTKNHVHSTLKILLREAEAEKLIRLDLLATYTPRGMVARRVRSQAELCDWRDQDRHRPCNRIICANSGGTCAMAESRNAPGRVWRTVVRSSEGLPY